jgi:hypothetical protein
MQRESRGGGNTSATRHAITRHALGWAVGGWLWRVVLGSRWGGSRARLMDARARAHTRRHLHQSRVEYVDPAMMRSVLHAARKTGKHARDASMFAWSMHACRRVAEGGVGVRRKVTEAAFLGGGADGRGRREHMRRARVRGSSSLIPCRARSWACALPPRGTRRPIC